VSSLKHRLDRLERESAERFKGERCGTCREWPRARVLKIDTDGNQSWADPTMAASCPHCGWSPVVVAIREVAEWDEVARVRS
jgi:hypothetical protein